MRSELKNILQSLYAAFTVPLASLFAIFGMLQFDSGKYVHAAGLWFIPALGYFFYVKLSRRQSDRKITVQSAVIGILIYGAICTALYLYR